MFDFIKKLLKKKGTAPHTTRPIKKVNVSAAKPSKTAEPNHKPDCCANKAEISTKTVTAPVSDALESNVRFGHFVVKKAVDGTYMFNLKAHNGEIIATSQTYASKKNCKNGIQSVRNNAVCANTEDQTINDYSILANPKFEIFVDKGGAHRFRLKAKNGNIIASSQGYSSKSKCIVGIESVKNNAAEASVIDETADGGKVS